MLGQDGFRQELELNGIQTIFLNHEDSGFSDEEALEFQCDPSVKAVVCGMDYQASYRKTCIASLYIQKGAKLICANPDRFSGSGDRLMPACGTITRTIELASGVTAPVMGKPETIGYEIIKKDQDIPDGAKVLMVGDNLETDIRFGVNNKIDTLLVLSGVALESHVGQLGSAVPTHIQPCLFHN